MLSEDSETLSEHGCCVWTGCKGSDTGLCNVAMLEATELLVSTELLAGDPDTLEQVSERRREREETFSLYGKVK